MPDIDQALLRQAHNGLSAMSEVCAAIRDNDLGAAERALAKVQDIVTKLTREIGDKARSSMRVPSPDRGRQSVTQSGRAALMADRSPGTTWR